MTEPADARNGAGGGLLEVMVIGMVALGAYGTVAGNPMVIWGGGAGVIVSVLVAVPLG